MQIKLTPSLYIVAGFDPWHETYIGPLRIDVALGIIKSHETPWDAHSHYTRGALLELLREHGLLAEPAPLGFERGMARRMRVIASSAEPSCEVCGGEGLTADHEIRSCRCVSDATPEEIAARRVLALADGRLHPGDL